jgi:hypothetical protein
VLRPLTELSQVDRRDLVARCGLANEDWPERLNQTTEMGQTLHHASDWSSCLPNDPNSAITTPVLRPERPQPTRLRPQAGTQDQACPTHNRAHIVVGVADAPGATSGQFLLTADTLHQPGVMAAGSR